MPAMSDLPHLTHTLAGPRALSAHSRMYILTVGPVAHCQGAQPTVKLSLSRSTHTRCASEMVSRYIAVERCMRDLGK